MDITEHALPTAVNPETRNEQTEIDKRAMNVLLRKIDLRLMPLLTLIFYFNYLDRINIGHSRRFGLIDDLNLSKSQYKWASSIFYIPHILCGVPSTFLMRRFSPSRWIAILMFTWGIITILMMLVKNLTGLLLARFFLGMAQAGVVPGFYYYLSLWYIRKDQAFRIGIFISGAPLAAASDGILAYGIEQIGGRESLSKWQWLCLVEGVPTVCLAIIAYRFLPDPATVQWLDQCNKDILTTRLLADAKVIGDTHEEPFSRQIRSLFLDWKVWFYIFIQFGVIMSFFSLSAFLPTIIENMYSTNATYATIGLLAIPYIASLPTLLISSWNAGRLNERSNHMMILLLIKISGFLYLILAGKLLYIGAMIVGTVVLSTISLNESWLTNNTGGQTKRAVAIAVLVAFGDIGALLGEQIYRGTDEDALNQGHWILIGILSFTFILVLLLKLLLNYENRRRRNLTTAQFQYGTITGERPILLNMHPDFVYVT